MNKILSKAVLQVDLPKVYSLSPSAVAFLAVPRSAIPTFRQGPVFLSLSSTERWNGGARNHRKWNRRTEGIDLGQAYFANDRYNIALLK